MIKSGSKRKHDGRKVTLFKNVKEFASRSTLHGVNYVFDQTVPSWDRKLWLLLSMGSAALAFSMVFKFYSDWQENPVMTTLKSLSKPVTELEFPAITICSSGQHMGLMKNVLFNNFQKWQKIQLKEENLAFEEELSLYLKDVFLINDTGTNILDMLGTMLAHSEDAAAANMVRQQLIACKQNNRRKRSVSGNFLYPSP